MFDIRTLDLFGIEPKWRIFKQDQFRTKFSALISIFFYIYFILKIIILLNKFFSRSDFEQSYNESIMTNEDTVLIKDIEIAYCMMHKITNEFVPVQNFLNITSSYIATNSIQEKAVDYSVLPIIPCMNIPENEIYLRKNFLLVNQKKILENCLCSYAKTTPNTTLDELNLKADPLFGNLNYIKYNFIMENQRVDFTNYTLNIKIKDFYLGPAVLSDNKLSKIKNQILVERINNYYYPLDTTIYKIVDFFVNENNYNQFQNMEFYDKTLLDTTKYSLSDKVGYETLSKSSREFGEDRRFSVFELNVYSNSNRIFNSIKFFGLDQFFAVYIGNIFFFFSIVNFIMTIFNNYHWNIFLEDVIDKRFTNHKQENKKLQAYFNMSYFSNLEKDEKDLKNVKNSDKDRLESEFRIKTHAKPFFIPLEPDSTRNFTKIPNDIEDDLTNNNITNIKNTQTLGNLIQETSNTNEKDLNKTEDIQNKANNTANPQNNVRTFQLNLNLNNSSKNVNSFFSNSKNSIKQDAEKLFSEKNSNNQINFKKKNNANSELETPQEYIKKYIALSTSNSQIKGEKKVKTINSKVFNLKETSLSDRYDIRKNIKDIFAIPKSRNKLIKDFIFKRVLDIDTYSNFLVEFYKLQKILLNKDLLVLFKKISNVSIFDQKNFSYYEYSIGNYYDKDMKILVDCDNNNQFDNLIYENLKREFYSTQNK